MNVISITQSIREIELEQIVANLHAQLQYAIAQLNITHQRLDKAERLLERIIHEETCMCICNENCETYAARVFLTTPNPADNPDNCLACMGSPEDHTCVPVSKSEDTITSTNPDYVLVHRLDLQEVLRHKDDTGFYPATAYNNLQAALEGKK
jgi:hypothetical protein